MLILLATLLMFPKYTVTLTSPVAQQFVSDTQGNTYFTSVAGDFAVSTSLLTKLAPNGSVVYQAAPAPSTVTLNGNTVPVEFLMLGALAADGDGNAYVAGSYDFPFLGRQETFVVKLDRQGKIAYTYLPGFDGAVSAIAVAPDGSVYLTGSAVPRLSRLVTTTGAWTSASKAAPDQTNPFVVRINPEGTGVVFATYLDNAPQSGQLQPLPSSYGLAIALDAQNNAYIAGTTEDPAFPTTSGVIRGDCQCSIGTASPFLLKLLGDGTKASYSLFLLPPTQYHETMQVSVDAGFRASVTQGPPPSGPAFQIGPYTDIPVIISTTVLDQYGISLLQYTATSFVTAGPVGASPDGQGNLLITGPQAPKYLPVSAGALHNGSAFAAVVRISDGKVLYATRLPAGAACCGITSDGNGGFLVAGAASDYGFPIPQAEIERFIPSATAQPSILGIANAVGLNISPGLAPGEVVSIYGKSLGPKTGLSGQFDSNGRLPFFLGGVQVYFDGIRAPLLYVSDEQVNAIVPFELQGRGVITVVAIVNGTVSNSATLPGRAADPELFKHADAAAPSGSQPEAFAVNEDGTVNSSQKPAKLGSVITVFVSGVGLLTPGPADGARGGLGHVPALPISASVGCKIVDNNHPFRCFVVNADILYSGSAPTLAAGILQVNLRLPQGIIPPLGGLIIQVGNGSTSVNLETVGTVWISSRQ